MTLIKFLKKNIYKCSAQYGKAKNLTKASWLNSKISVLLAGIKMYFNTITANMCTLENKENTARKLTKRRKRKHIPHAQRSSEYVEKRNKRERTRIRAVNEAFERLRERVPSCAQDPDLRISKMEILTHAIGYIEGLCVSLGYRDFAEYCRWEGHRTVPGRGKENPGQEQQVRDSSISSI